MRCAYDPGCFRPPGGGACDPAVPAAARALGLELEEVEDPGDRAAGALSMNGIAAYARVGRLLALAARQLASRADAGAPPSLVSPCGDCHRNLVRAIRSLREHTELREQVREELAEDGLELAPDAVRVRHLLDVLHEDVGIEAIRARVRRPLSGLRAAPYYGCFRKGSEVGAAGTGRLEGLLSALGAEVVDLPLKEHCCGGRAADASPEVATSLQHRILRAAAEGGADVLVAVCPRCRGNLEAGQAAANRRFETSFEVPVRHFADLLGEAFGLAAPGAASAEGPG